LDAPRQMMIRLLAGQHGRLYRVSVETGLSGKTACHGAARQPPPLTVTIDAMMRTLSTRMKWILGIVAGLVVLVAGATAGYAAYFADRALPGVTVAGVAATGQTQQEVADALRQRAEGIAVAVDVDGTTTTASLADLGVSVDAEATAAAAFEPNASVAGRLRALVSHRDVPAVATTDEAALASFADGLSAAAGTPVQDATVALAADGTSFQATPASPGIRLDASPLADAAGTAASTLASQTVALQPEEVQPAVTTEDARAVADAANALVALDVTLTDGITDFTATPADKASWVTIPAPGDEGGAGALGTPAFDRDKVAAWVLKTGESSNEDPVAGVNNVNSRGDVVSVASAGEPGWKVSNADVVAQAVFDSLSKGQSFSGDFDYDRVEQEFTTQLIADGAENLVYQAAPGEKWIDIDLSNYTVSAYEGATIVRGPVPMVPGMPGLETVTGTYHVTRQVASETMRGNDLDGTPYVTPNVPWATYFYSGYALHGAPWRTSFGWGGPGGSHGCVNMPVDEAKWIYDWAEIGTTVVSHY
jgi:lipoprotein-anchoring transpeptidase ErfK/SrfK